MIEALRGTKSLACWSLTTRICWLPGRSLSLQRQLCSRVYQKLPGKRWEEKPQCLSNGKNNYKQESPVMGPKHGFQLPAVESTEPVPRGIFSQREIQLPKLGETTLTGTVPIRFIKQVIRKQSGPKSVPPVQSLISSRLKIDFQAVITPGALAGRLRFFLPNWQQITLDPVLLVTVRGYKLELTSPPIHNRIRAPPRFSHTESEKIDIEITALLDKGALNKVEPVSGQFLSNIFLVPKRDGKSRPVINLKYLNAHIQYDHFKIEDTHLLRDLLQPQDWLEKIDLKDAYFVIPIWKEHRKYLRFVWKSTLLEFACLPFGLTAAPRLFTKVMKPVVALLRRAGIRLIINIPGRSFVHESIQGRPTTRYGYGTVPLRKFRFCDKFREVRCFTPTQTLEFLGFLVNTRDMTLHLPDYKVEGIKADCNNLIARHEVWSGNYLS